MLDVTFGAALLAGLLSFVSPCVLPIVPPYLAYLAGVSFSQIDDSHVDAATKRRIVLSSAFFVLGFTCVFVMFGATASILGKSLAEHFDVLSVVAGVLIVVMGIHFTGLVRIPLLYREARLNAGSKGAGYVGAFVMGLAFAFGWTPCVGPVLAAILFMAGAQQTVGHGALLLAAYSLGIGIPFFLAALFAARFLKFVARFRRHLHKVEIAMGGFLIVTGVLFITGQMSAISQWLLDTFPGYATLG